MVGAAKIGGVLLAVFSVMLSSCSTHDPYCSDYGMTMASIDDTSVPQGVKDSIYQSGDRIISKGELAYPSGKVVVIPFETSDFPKNPAVTKTYLSSIFFPTGLKDVSIANYFKENSWTKFQVTSGGISDWVSLPAKLAGFGPIGGLTLAKAVVSGASINWAALDANHDNDLSRNEAAIVLLIPNADSALTYGDAQTGSAGPFDLGGIHFDADLRFVKFSVVRKTDPLASTNPIRRLSSLAHELAHAFFGLPDRYSGGAFVTGTGAYDLMATDRSWKHLTMYDKMKIGWIQPKIVDGHLGKCLQFSASELTQTGLVILADSTSANEYWVVEVREKSASFGAFDQDLPDSGLAVWWVRQGTWAGGYDEVRLVDAGKPDQKATKYGAPGPDALFEYDPQDPLHFLLDAAGATKAMFRDVSPSSAVMYAEF